MRDLRQARAPNLTAAPALPGTQPPPVTLGLPAGSRELVFLRDPNTPARRARRATPSVPAASCARRPPLPPAAGLPQVYTGCWGRSQQELEAHRFPSPPATSPSCPPTAPHALGSPVVAQGSREPRGCPLPGTAAADGARAEPALKADRRGRWSPRGDARLGCHMAPAAPRVAAQHARAPRAGPASENDPAPETRARSPGSAGCRGITAQLGQLPGRDSQRETGAQRAAGDARPGGTSAARAVRPPPGPWLPRARNARRSADAGGVRSPARLLRAQRSRRGRQGLTFAASLKLHPNRLVDVLRQVQDALFLLLLFVLQGKQSA